MSAIPTAAAPSETRIIKDNEGLLPTQEPVPNYLALVEDLDKVVKLAKADAKHYGGAELDADSGESRIYLVRGGEETRRRIDALSKPDKARRVFVGVEFSRATLLEVRDRIRDDYAWREQEGLLLSTWGPDEKSNKVRVGVPSLDADKVRRLGER